MSPHKPSHLSEASANGRKYDYKRICEFCTVHFDRDLSNALEPNLYCCLECECNDTYLTEQYRKSE